MSFTASTKGSGFSAGRFLAADEACVRITQTIKADHAQKTTVEDRTIVPAGAVIPANDATAVGVLYEDIDVTNGDAIGSVVVEGTVYTDKLPAAISDSASLAGIKAIASSPAVTRPY